MEKGAFAGKSSDPNISEMNAKELTAAIDAATDYLVEQEAGEQETNRAGGAEIVPGGGADVGSDEKGTFRNLGQVAQSAQTIEGVLRERQVIASNNEVKQIVANENGYSTSGNLSPEANVIGGESQRQIKDREKAEAELAKAQSGVDTDDDQQWTHEIAKKSEKELASYIQGAVAKALEEKKSEKDGVNPLEIERIRFLAMIAAIKAMGDPGRSFGSYN